LNNDQRRRLAVLGLRLGRGKLREVATLVMPDTILRWLLTVRLPPRQTPNSGWLRAPATSFVWAMRSPVFGDLLLSLAALSIPARWLCLLKSPFLLQQLMLQPTTDTLLGDDVGACLAPPDPR
jgi:hypothetical protein